MASVGIAGQLRIGASPIARLTVTPLLQAAWTHARPGIAVHVIETATGPLLRAVGSGELDMAGARWPLHVLRRGDERPRAGPGFRRRAGDHPRARPRPASMERRPPRVVVLGGGGPGR